MAEIYQVYEAISSNTHMFLTELDKTKQNKKNNKKTLHSRHQPGWFCATQIALYKYRDCLNYTECRYKEG